MNYVNPSVGAEIVSHIELDGIRYTGEEAAALLLASQIQGIRMLVNLGIPVKINTVFIAGINDHEVAAVARLGAALGAAIHNILPLIPVPGSAFAQLPKVDTAALLKLRAQCSEHLRQMYHCRHCRADAAGLLHEDISALLGGVRSAAAACRPPAAPVLAACQPPAAPAAAPAVAGQMHGTPTVEGPLLLVAVASKSGMVVDQHFGHVQSFSIYQTNGSEVRYVEERPIARYCTGIGECEDSDKQQERAATIALLADCAALCVLRIGYTPETILTVQGVVVVETCSRVEDAVVQAYQTVLQSRNTIAMSGR